MKWQAQVGLVVVGFVLGAMTAAALDTGLGCDACSVTVDRAQGTLMCVRKPWR